jgi:tetraacyldisaccharide 4'-kinase
MLYGLGISFRNMLYDLDLVKASTFNLPIISVGNLSIGGAGKTPHVEYLITLLSPYIDVGTLSRGYKRKSKGFFMVRETDNVLKVGDEPLQFKKKYKDIAVAVSESRVLGIPEMLKQAPETKVVILDDAYQHRSVVPGMNILLTDFSNLFTDDFLLPSGRLREWRSAYKRADMIIVTKCPRDPSLIDRETIVNKINPTAKQKVYFSYYEYGKPYYMYNNTYQLKLSPDIKAVVVSAIARVDYLLEFLEPTVDLASHFVYEDHHLYTEHEISVIKQTYDTIENDKKVILTTEKDAMRMDLHRAYLLENKLPIYILPIKVAFHYQEDGNFDDSIKDFLLNFRV